MRSSVLRSLLLFATFSFKKKKLSVLSLQGKSGFVQIFITKNFQAVFLAAQKKRMDILHSLFCFHLKIKQREL